MVLGEMVGEVVQEVRDTHGVGPGAGAQGAGPEVGLAASCCRVDHDHLDPSAGEVMQGEQPQVLSPGAEFAMELCQHHPHQMVVVRLCKLIQVLEVEDDHLPRVRL